MLSLNVRTITFITFRPEQQARGSSIGGDSDGPATTLGSTSGGEEPPAALHTSRLDPPVLSKEQLRKNEEALHDAQVEMEQDDLVSVGSVAQPLGSPMRPSSMMATNMLVEVQDTKVGLHDFELLSVVGQGAFGKV